MYHTMPQRKIYTTNYEITNKICILISTNLSAKLVFYETEAKHTA